MQTATEPKPIYRVTSLGGEPISETDRAVLLADAVARQDKIFCALVQLLEEEMETFRSEACSPEKLVEGTQPHYAGGADALNGALLKIAETAAEGQRKGK